MINNSLALYVISAMLEDHTYQEVITKGKDMIPHFKQQIKENGCKTGKITKNKFIVACWEEIAVQEEDGIYDMEAINRVKSQLPAIV